MKITLSAVFFLASITISSFAQESGEDRIYAAFDLLVAMGLEQQSDETIDRMVTLEVENNPGLMPFRHVLVKFYKKHLGYESTKYETAELYASVFSLKEIKELTDFYNTELGKKVMQKTPELVQKSSQIGIQAVQRNIFELQEMIKDESLRIQKLQKSASN